MELSDRNVGFVEELRRATRRKTATAVATGLVALGVEALRGRSSA